MHQLRLKDIIHLSLQILILILIYVLILFWVDSLLILVFRVVHLQLHNNFLTRIMLRILPRIVGVVFMLLLAKFWDGLTLSGLGISFSQKWIIKWVRGFAVGVIGLSLLIVFYSIVFHVKFTENFSFSGVLRLFLSGIIITSVQAASEEILFRGYLNKVLTPYVKSGTAIIISAVLFGLYHFFTGRLDLPLFTAMILFGIFCGLYRLNIDQGSLWGIFGFHAAWNFTQEFVFRTSFLTSRIENSVGIIILLIALIFYASKKKRLTDSARQAYT